MITYTKKNVLIITLTITVIIYVVISVIWSSIHRKEQTIENTQEEIIETQVTEENIEPEKEKKHIWKIEIPKINLSADIAEGTSSKVIAKYVGHFARNWFSRWKHRLSST